MARLSLFSGEETEVIRRHRFDTVSYLLAERDVCLELARDRVQGVTGRTLRHITLDQLPSELPESWMLAVLHCPEDDIERLADWARRLTVADQNRVLFYEPESHPRDEAARALRPWMRAGLPAPVRHRVADRKELNRVLGNDLNWRILEDHRARD